MTKINLITLAFVAVCFYTEAKQPENKKQEKVELTEAQEKASIALYEETFAGSITPERIEELIKQGAKIEYVDGSGFSVRDQAVLTRNKPVDDYLKQKGARTTKTGFTAAAAVVIKAHAHERSLATKTLEVFAKESKADDAQVEFFKMMYADAMERCYTDAPLSEEEREFLKNKPKELKEAQNIVKMEACTLKSQLRMVLTELNIMEKGGKKPAEKKA